MKLLRLGQKGQERLAVIDIEGNYRNLSADYSDLSNGFLPNLYQLESLDLEAYPVIDDFPRIGPCVADVGKFICVVLNYSDYTAESNMLSPKEPILIFKARSAICGPNDDIIIPPGSSKTDWEVELGVIIGKEARCASEADAIDHVAGYCVVNELPGRSYQLKCGGQWVKEKSSVTFGSIGPWLITKDELLNPGDLSIWLDADGHRFQDGSTQIMIFGVPNLISYISHFMSLQSGDVISTRRPPGVGMGQDPEVYLRPGQTTQFEVDRLGEQKQKTVISIQSSANALN